MSIALGIEDRSAHLMVIETAGSARQMITSVLQSLGFKKITSVDGIQAALDYLSQEEADFIFCPLVKEDYPNALHLLHVLQAEPVLSGIPVALFVSEDSVDCIPVAFEMGVISFHPRYFSRESVVAEISKLLKVLQTAGSETSLCALDFLYKFYLAQQQFEVGRRVVEGYLSHFPDARLARLFLADACLAGGDREEGTRLLGQFKALNFPGWREVATQHFRSPDEVSAQIGFTPCLVVDSDESVHNNLRALFAEFPEFRIVPFESALAADEWCRRYGPPGMIIQEWKQRDLPGPALLQRLRQRGWHDVPVLVLSSLVGKADAPLLKEMGVTEVFPKPLIRETFRESMIFALQQQRDPTDLGVLERKILNLLNLGNYEYAKHLWARVRSHPKAKPGTQKYIESLFYFSEQRWEDARRCAFEAVQQGGDALKCLTVLARTLVRLRDFAGAVRCFERARELSPENVERLCDLADAYSEAGEISKAEVALEGAKHRDPLNEKVIQTETKVAIRAGQTERARGMIILMGQVSGLVSEMNNSAIALAKVGEFDQAVDLYRHTMAALPEEFSEMRQRVRYNLALAYARAGRLKDTLVELEVVQEGGGNTGSDSEVLLKKLNSLRAKVRKSMESKRPLKLVGESGGEESLMAEALAVVGEKSSEAASLDPLAGRRSGLQGIFHAQDDERQVLTQALSRDVKFKRRSAAS